MFGLNVKVTASMLINILVVHGKIYLEDSYLMDSNHVELYHRLYSDNDGSDVFDNIGSANFDVPKPNLEEPRHWFPVAVEDNVDQGNKNVNGKRYDRPSWWKPTLVDNNNNDDIAEGKDIDSYPTTRKPGHGAMRRKCRKLKGLPTPDSGCCGVQLPKLPAEEYAKKPWWPQMPGSRFTRAAKSDILPSGMISGGKATDFHHYPWMVRLSIDASVNGIGSTKSCGGTIISSRYVLTAAHCLYQRIKDLEKLTVILAEYNSEDFPEDCIGKRCIMNQEKKVDHVIIHPEFNRTFLLNDVALIRLSSDIKYTALTRPICLPTSDIVDLSEEPLIIAGWGNNGRTESKVKRSAIISYVSDSDCKKEYSYKDEGKFCSIGSNGEDICHGDSGGPLMVHSNGKYFLSGVVSGKRGDQECGSSLPSLFNNVFYYLNWIKKHVH